MDRVGKDKLDSDEVGEDSVDEDSVESTKEGGVEIIETGAE